MASNSDDPKFLNRQLAEFVIDELNKSIASRNYGRVQRSFNSFLASSTFVRIFSIYHFVRAWNDGRKPVHRTREQGPMIFFPDIKDDPRVRLRYPRRPQDRIKITPEQMRAARKQGQVVVTYDTPAVAGEHFIEEAIDNARPKIRAAGIRAIRGRFRDIIKTSKMSGVTYLNL